MSVQKTIGDHCDASAIRHQRVQSVFQRTENTDGSPAYTDLRILVPTAGVKASTRFLYVLPVQAGAPTSAKNWRADYGDGIMTIEQLKLHDIHNLVVIEAGYNAPDPATDDEASGPAPWYADHPSDLSIRQESYLVKEIIPRMDRLFPQAAPVRMLLGYSKSGWGAISLILRHPELFHAAAAWDAPLMMQRISPVNYKNEDMVFGHDNDYFAEHYRLDTQLTSAPAVMKKTKRLWIGINPRRASGYRDDFAGQNEDFIKLLSAQGIQHTVHREARPFLHTWGPTDVYGKRIYWELNAVDFLLHAAPLPRGTACTSMSNTDRHGV